MLYIIFAAVRHNLYMKKMRLILCGLAAGLANGLLGAGGGMIVVPLLRKLGLDVKHAHATSISVILPLSAVSAVMYLTRGDVVLSDALIYLPFGIVGAVLGAAFFKKLPDKFLRGIFGVFILYAGVRSLIS